MHIFERERFTIPLAVDCELSQRLQNTGSAPQEVHALLLFWAQTP